MCECFQRYLQSVDLRTKEVHIGCIRLASLGRPRCVVRFFFQDERVQIITHIRPRKKNATHRGRLMEAKRTHPLCKDLHTSTQC